MMGENKNYNFDTRFFELLTIAFIVLKLCHVIDWSWWWVLAPMWIPISIVILIVCIMVISRRIKRKKLNKRH